MSCRDTKGGTLTTRLARQYSGLPDRKVRSLFHQLKREGAKRPPPTEQEIATWRAKYWALIDNAKMSDRARAASERDLMIAATENPDPATFHAWNNIDRVARGQAVILALKGQVTDLAPPGSQIGQYEWGDDGRPARIWYASYGSNMDRSRFLTYVQGGTPPGSHSPHEGCRDRSLPAGDIPIRFRGRAHFAYHSGRWGGGVAFLDNDGESLALGRAYNVAIGQFDDIVAQENGRRPSGAKTPTDEVLANGSAVMTRGVYGTLEHIGDYQGAPVFTFTGDFTAQEALEESFAAKPDFYSTNEPSPNYLRMLGSGLAETFHMTDRQQADYLRGFPGMEKMGRRRLLRILRTPPEEPPASQAPLFTSPKRERGGGHTGGWAPSSWEGAAPSMARYDSFGSDNLSSEDNEALWRQMLEDYEEQAARRKFMATESRRRGGCMFCGQPGHKMGDCPSLPSRKTN